jgi:uncharacterized membrane protein
MMRKIMFFVLAGILVMPTIISCSKKDNSTPDGEKYFPTVKTIITSNCMTCHNSSGTWAGRPTKFDTDADISAAAGAIKSAVADPVTITNKRMPQGGSLSASDIDVIVKWFNKGGKLTD